VKTVVYAVIVSTSLSLVDPIQRNVHAVSNRDGAANEDGVQCIELKYYHHRCSYNHCLSYLYSTMIPDLPAPVHKYTKNASS
jgi:hypothetical protein